MDISGSESLTREAVRRRKIGGGLYFHFMKDAVRQTLDDGGYLKTIGDQNIFAQKTDAIAAIYPRLDPEVCRRCTARIFPECHRSLPNGEPRSG